MSDHDEEITITVTPPPAGAGHGDALTPDERGGMLADVRRCVWSVEATDDAVFDAVWARSDGYGEPGTVPPQGYDWSGIRDSSDHAVREMHAELVRRRLV